MSNTISNSALLRQESVKQVESFSTRPSPFALSLSRADRKYWQNEFSLLGKGPPSLLLKVYFPKRLFFEPTFDANSLGCFLQHYAHNTVEIVFHNLFHITARLGDRWVDFHFGARCEPTIVCTEMQLNLNKPKRAAVKVRNLMSHYGRRHGKAFSFGVCLPLPAERIKMLHDELQEMKEPVPFGMGGEGGDTCLTLLTELISKAPELGISRTADCSEFFQKTLRRNPVSRVITLYSCSSYSHLRHPLRRMAKLALGPPRAAQLLKMWEREFAIPIPDQLYDKVSLTEEQILSARASREALKNQV